MACKERNIHEPHLYTNTNVYVCAYMRICCLVTDCKDNGQLLNEVKMYYKKKAIYVIQMTLLFTSLLFAP